MACFLGAFPHSFFQHCILTSIKFITVMIETFINVAQCFGCFHYACRFVWHNNKSVTDFVWHSNKSVEGKMSAK